MTKKWNTRTQLVHEGSRRSQYGEMAEAIFLTQGFAYPDAETAEARIRAVRELHSGSRLIPGTPIFGCPECGEPNETEPCATILALDGGA